MYNLAGNKHCNSQIILELRHAGIPIITEDHSKNEVPATVAGSLGQYHFVRAWYYWMVSGNVPLKVAQELYSDPTGATDVRVVGHCGCPPPDEWVTWLDREGQPLLDINDKAKYERLVKDKIIKDLNGLHFSSKDQFANLGQAYIRSYHIDSQEGLVLFVETLRKHNLV